MSYPPKMAKLCSDLQCYIHMHCKPGDKLPSERVLSKIMGVSSRTLGTAMRKLVEQRRLIRTPRGSFVIDENNLSTQEDEPLTVLLPCTDFSFNKDTVSSLASQLLIRGALAVSKKYHSRVVTIPVTESNDPDDINPNQLSQLNSRSMVMFYSKWFEPLFPLFRERHCRLAFLSCAEYTPDNLPAEMDCFMVSRRNYLSGLFEQGISWLVRAGARRIVYALCAMSPKKETCMQMFDGVLKKHHVEGKLFLGEKHWNFRQCTEWLKQIYAKEKFDGLLLYSDPLGFYDPDLDFYDETGLPADLPLLVSESSLINQAKIGRHAGVIYIPSLHYGMRGAEFLLSGRHGKEFTVAEYVIEPAEKYRGTGGQGFSIF